MKINALIVDDNETDRYILTRWLKASSFDAIINEATDGQSAIDFFASALEAEVDGYPPSVVFLDINMPRVNGFEFLERFSQIREQHGLTSTAIVMFTSSPRQDDKEKALQWDFVEGFLIKGEFAAQEIEETLARQTRLQSNVVGLPASRPATNAEQTGPL